MSVGIGIEYEIFRQCVPLKSPSLRHVLEDLAVAEVQCRTAEPASNGQSVSCRLTLSTLEKTFVVYHSIH